MSKTLLLPMLTGTAWQVAVSITWLGISKGRMMGYASETDRTSNLLRSRLRPHQLTCWWSSFCQNLWRPLQGPCWGPHHDLKKTPSFDSWANRGSRRSVECLSLMCVAGCIFLVLCKTGQTLAKEWGSDDEGGGKPCSYLASWMADWMFAALSKNLSSASLKTLYNCMVFSLGPSIL